MKRLGGLVAGEHVAKSRATAPVAMIHTVTTSFEHDEVRHAGDGADSKGSTSIALGRAGASKSSSKRRDMDGETDLHNQGHRRGKKVPAAWVVTSK